MSDISLTEKILNILKFNSYITGYEIIKSLDKSYYKSPGYLYGFLNALSENGIIKVKKVSKTTFLFYI